MISDNAHIAKAIETDLDDLFSLLTTVSLPHEGVAEHHNNFFVARNQENQLIACAGLEHYGKLALLRSVAVSPDSQNTGIGSKLTAVLLDQAAKAGIEEVVLLTTTARDFFAHRFGFVETSREAYKERLDSSPEWSLPRCSSAVFMRLQLK
jgi:amino-acid N-acetyltransferase